MVAGEENHVELAEFFVAKGANVNHPEIHGYLPISRASLERQQGHRSAVQKLTEPHAHPPRFLGAMIGISSVMEIGQ